MKILTKRVIAIIIDAVALVTVLFLLFLYFEGQRPGEQENVLEYVWLFAVCFVMKDVVFKNASIGKKAMGISIYRKNLSKPTHMESAVRTIKMLFIGSLIFFKSLIKKRSMCSFFDWELDELNTMVIDNEIFFMIQSKASLENNDLGSVYREYTESIYK